MLQQTENMHVNCVDFYLNRPNLRVFSSETLSAGEDWESKLKDEISQCDVFVVLLSSDSVNSEWVLSELGAAWALNKPVIPVVTHPNVFSEIPVDLGEAQLVEIKHLESHPEVINQILSDIETRKAEGAPLEPAFEPLGLEVAKLTVKGRSCPINQDRLETYTPSDPRLINQRGCLFLMTDGFNPGGEVASRLAVDTIREEYYADAEKDIPASLTHAIEAANEVIYQQARENRAQWGMGTTVVAAVVRGRELYVANVGDSRAYLIRSDEIDQITSDHSVVAEWLREGKITPEKAGNHPQISVLTRALGLHRQVEVDVSQRKLERGDIIVLCSDGLASLREFVRDREIKEMVNRYPPASVAERLVRLAKNRGSSDDISIIVIRAGSKRP